ncbi:hypothetical protein ColTof3_04737 [Colletotrichum tofieldiae]|nr:hypothetical protein ColTof3_04737 [Colletotrichum tofieldiae]
MSSTSRRVRLAPNAQTFRHGHGNRLPKPIDQSPLKAWLAWLSSCFAPEQGLGMDDEGGIWGGTPTRDSFEEVLLLHCRRRACSRVNGAFQLPNLRMWGVELMLQTPAARPSFALLMLDIAAAALAPPLPGPHLKCRNLGLVGDWEPIPLPLLTPHAP